MRSLPARRPINSTSKGVVIMISEAWISLVMLRPWKKNSWLAATPKAPQRANSGQSLRSTGSRTTIRWKAMNMPSPSTTRIRMKAKGGMYPSRAILAMP
jgi:hypothetical protein